MFSTVESNTGQMRFYKWELSRKWIRLMYDKPSTQLAYLLSKDTGD